MHIKQKSSKKTTIFVAAALALLAGGVLLFALINNKGQQTREDENSSTNTINYGPPTEDEIENSQNAKDRIVEESDGNSDSQSESSSSTAKKPATVSVSFADIVDGNLEIRASTASAIEGTGECTATVSKPDSQSITKKVSAFIDASSTICNPIYISTSQLSTGTWNVNVTYSSPTYEGSSDSMQVEVK